MDLDKSTYSPIRLFASLAVVFLVTEFGVIPVLGRSLFVSGVAEASIRLFFLTAMSFSVIYFFGYAPFVKKMISGQDIDETRNEFVSLASHQLRTPLTAIKLFLELLENETVGPLNAEQKDYVKDLQQSTDKLIRLTNNLLNVSRMEAGKLVVAIEPTDFVALISDVIDELKSWIKAKNCNFAFVKPEQPLPLIPLDETLMRQVVINLISNAVKYARSGKGDVVVTLESQVDGYLFSVKDNGIGIPADIRGKIFRKFFRSDIAARIDTTGSGLGLYVIKMIVELGGGRIWFESSEGQGSEFFVKFPLQGMKSRTAL